MLVVFPCLPHRRPRVRSSRLALKSCAADSHINRLLRHSLIDFIIYYYLLYVQIYINICNRASRFRKRGSHLLSFSKFMYESKTSRGKLHKPAKNSSVSLKFPICIGPAWDLRPKPSHADRRPVPSDGTYIGWDGDKYINK